MRRFLVCLAVVAGVIVAGIPAALAQGSDPLDAVTVTGDPGQAPTVTFAAPFAVKSSVADQRAAGSGAAAKKGSRILLDYVIVNGRDGSQVETSYGKNPVTLLLDKKTSQPALYAGLIGAAPGSRVVVAIAPKDGLAANGAQLGVKKDDTLLFVIDVKDVRTPLKRATGTTVTPPAGLPTVTLAKSGKPTIEMPKDPPPSTLVAQPLVKGDGPVVRAGQTLRVHYTGAIWRNGRVFDSSWTRGEPDDFPIGAGQVIEGWDQGLVGQTVGSQVLLVVPPDLGYGASGNPQIGVTGNDTMVFVIDILDAS